MTWHQPTLVTWVKHINKTRNKNVHQLQQRLTTPLGHRKFPKHEADGNLHCRSWLGTDAKRWWS